MQNAVPRLLLPSLRPALRSMRVPRPAAAARPLHSTPPRPQPSAASGIPFESIYTQETDVGAIVGGLTAHGIELVSPSELVVPGSAILLGGKTFLWDVRPPAKGDELSWKGWHEDAFKVFEVVGPRPGAFQLALCFGFALGKG